MAFNWTNIQNGNDALSIRGKLNSLGNHLSTLSINVDGISDSMESDIQKINTLDNLLFPDGYESSNIMFGKDTYGEINIGTNNIAIGESTLQYGGTKENICIGLYAGGCLGTTYTSGNIAIGTRALGVNSNNTGIIQNIAIGKEALGGVSSASSSNIYGNICLGANSGYDFTKSSNSVCIGNATAQSIDIINSPSVVIGNLAGGSSLQSGNLDSAVIIGAGAGYSTVHAGANFSKSTIIGYEASNMSYATSSVVIGYQASNKDSSGIGSNNIQNATIIGNETRITLNSDNEIAIGYLAQGGGSNTITLGNTSITQLRCKVSTITTISDERAKKDIELADKDILVNALMDIPVKRYMFNSEITEEINDKHIVGFIAQDVQRVFPKSVTVGPGLSIIERDEAGNPIEEIIQNDETGEIEYSTKTKVTLENPLGLSQDFAIPTLWAVCQKLVEEVENLKTRIAILENK